MSHQLQTVPMSGENHSKKRDLDGNPRVTLTRLSHVRDELARIYRSARSGRIETQEATRLCYILNTLAKIIESQELEKRLELLEAEHGKH